MRGYEEAIEKVLAGLRDAEAPVGMERRILNALEERESVGARFGWRSLVRGLRAASESRAVVWGVGLAGLVVLALVIPVVRRTASAPVLVKGSPEPAAAVVMDRAAVEGVAKSAPVRLAGARVRAVAEAKATAVEDSDALAVEEMRAESRPAPPLPLTEQERLMLRLARVGERRELAKLDPMLRMDQEAQEAAEFQRFFEPVESVAEPDGKQSDSTVEKEGDGR